MTDKETWSEKVQAGQRARVDINMRKHLTYNYGARAQETNFFFKSHSVLRSTLVSSGV